MSAVDPVTLAVLKGRPSKSRTRWTRPCTGPRSIRLSPRRATPATASIIP